ncbi:hypothetical protein B0H12DRAFT_810928 [Mycena haematopus]|nr:hypothetical protein B0H12DRAFT_810928 [Mycena haematopus]
MTIRAVSFLNPQLSRLPLALVNNRGRKPEYPSPSRYSNPSGARDNIIEPQLSIYVAAAPFYLPVRIQTWRDRNVCSVNIESVTYLKRRFHFDKTVVFLEVASFLNCLVWCWCGVEEQHQQCRHSMCNRVQFPSQSSLIAVSHRIRQSSRREVIPPRGRRRQRTGPTNGKGHPNRCNGAGYPAVAAMR